MRHIIEQKQELLTRESISRPALDYSEGMTAEEQKRYINYLAERVREADLGLRSVSSVLGSLTVERASPTSAPSRVSR